jgi:hypothetical protein
MINNLRLSEVNYNERRNLRSKGIMEEYSIIVLLATGIFVVSYLLGYYMRVIDALSEVDDEF